MRRFRDRQNRVWDLEINVSQIKRVRDLLKVDLYKLVDDGLRPLAELMGDPVKLVDVVFALLEKRARDAGVSDEDFGRAMAGEAIQEAAEAFAEELFDFFPETRTRLTLRKIRDKQRQIVEAMADQSDQAIDTMIPQEVVERIRRVMVPSGSSGGAPASSESTPESGPSPS